MADPVLSPTGAASPPVTADPAAAVAAPPAAAPAAVEPATAPVTSAPVNPPVTETTKADAKPVEPAPKVEPAASVPTLLEKFDKEKADAEAAKTAAKAEPEKPKAEAKPGLPTAPDAAAKPAEQPAPGTAPPVSPAATAPVEYKYTLPETIKMDDAARGEVHKAFDEFRANPSEGAQGLINLHESRMRDFAQFLADEQQRVFKETRAGWAKQILSDPELGGSGHQTAMGAVARMRDMLVPEKERPAFEEFLRVTGAGDHPQFLKLLHQAARYFDEPSLPPPNPRPPSTNGQRPSRRLRDVYDHPRSNPEGRS